MRPFRLTLLAASVLTASTVDANALNAQALTLRDALARADAGAFANRAADGAADAADARTVAALRGILPSVRLESGFARTTDPIGAFGTTLRQRAITPADFDPARLNYPDAISTFQGGAVLEQPILNVDAWMGRRAAARAGDAARMNAEWGRLGTRVDVIRAYFGATLAGERVATLEAAARAARAHVRQAEAMVREGLATNSDALLASVSAGEVEADLATAQADAHTALRQLALVLGAHEPVGAVPVALPDAATIRAIVAGDTADVVTTRAGRPDVAAATLGVEAARADARRARALYLPRVNAVLRYDWYSAVRPYDGDHSWTVGVQASWSPFAGASEIAEGRMAGAHAKAARAMADGARARAALEAEQGANALRAALAGLDIAERAVAQSAEAHRIVARKYAGGLATVVELLDAAAVETRSALRFSAARHAAIVAAAERRKALGRDPGALVALEAATPSAPSAPSSPSAPTNR